MQVNKGVVKYPKRHIFKKRATIHLTLSFVNTLFYTFANSYLHIFYTFSTHFLHICYQPITPKNKKGKHEEQKWHTLSPKKPPKYTPKYTPKHTYIYTPSPPPTVRTPLEKNNQNFFQKTYCITFHTLLLCIHRTEHGTKHLDNHIQTTRSRVVTLSDER